MCVCLRSCWCGEPRNKRVGRARLCRAFFCLGYTRSLARRIRHPPPDSIPVLFSVPSSSQSNPNSSPQIQSTRPPPPPPPSPSPPRAASHPRPLLDPEIPRGSLRSCAEFAAHFGSNSDFAVRASDPEPTILRPQAAGIEPNEPSADLAPRGAFAGVDAAAPTGRWIADPSGVTRARPRPPRPRSPGRPRPRSPGRPRRRTRASAGRCWRRRGGPRAGPRARASPSGPSGACSGRTPTGRSSSRSSSSSPVIQVTRRMNIWTLAYAQSCKYRRAESPVHLTQVDSKNV